MMFPLSDLTISLLKLIGDPSDEDLLDAAWDEWAIVHPGDTHGFIAVAKVICDRPVIVRHNCATFAAPCEACGDNFDPDDMTVIGGDLYCDDCRIDNFVLCHRCDEYASVDDYVTDSNDNCYCDRCSSHLNFCEDCDVYYDPDYDSHDHGCNCEAPNQTFTFPANGKGRIGNDERLTVKLPSGTIDEMGMSLILDVVYSEGTLSSSTVRGMLEEVGPQWQTTRGNFTRRLSSAYYKATKAKFPDGVLSKIGNLARAHSDDSSEWYVEFTRDLNLSAEDFYHEDSCWWQSYYESRCALKGWGGIGLRSFDDPERSDSVSGRAWVQPLNSDLKPTHDAMGAHAYIVYNGYGDLDGYKAARIVAHLTSKTYRKVDLSASPQYVNSGVGYLVADEATCAATTAVDYYYQAHDTLDALTFANNDKEAA